MKRDRITDARADVHLNQMLDEAGSILNADYIQVVYARRPRRL